MSNAANNSRVLYPEVKRIEISTTNASDTCTPSAPIALRMVPGEHCRTVHDNASRVSTVFHTSARSRYKPVRKCANADIVIPFIMFEVSHLRHRYHSLASKRLLSGLHIPSDPVVQKRQDTDESSDRKSHFYDTHCRMSSLFRVKIFTAAHKNSIRRYLLAEETVLPVSLSLSLSEGRRAKVRAHHGGRDGYGRRERVEMTRHKRRPNSYKIGEYAGTKHCA